MLVLRELIARKKSNIVQNVPRIVSCARIQQVAVHDVPLEEVCLLFVHALIDSMMTL